MQRLQELRHRDQRRALFGDSPPPPGTAAPYPEGEVIYQCNHCYVVKHGDAVTKYTTHPDGMGANQHPNEAQVLRFLKEQTTIPVPEAISSDWDRVTMEYVPGQPLKDVWGSLESDQRSEILAQPSDYIAQIRALKGIQLGRLDGQGAIVPSIFTRSGGPFSTLREFQEWLAQPRQRSTETSIYWQQITTQLDADYPIVFTYGDISSRNVHVRDGRIVALLDRELAGWYLDYWDYVFAMCGLDNVDWATLGNRMPSLFPKRYDLEYILVKFILSLS